MKTPEINKALAGALRPAARALGLKRAGARAFVTPDGTVRVEVAPVPRSWSPGTGGRLRATVRVGRVELGCVRLLPPPHRAQAAALSNRVLASLDLASVSADVRARVYSPAPASPRALQGVPLRFLDGDDVAAWAGLLAEHLGELLERAQRTAALYERVATGHTETDEQGVQVVWAWTQCARLVREPGPGHRKAIAAHTHDGRRVVFRGNPAFTVVDPDAAWAVQWRARIHVDARVALHPSGDRVAVWEPGAPGGVSLIGPDGRLAGPVLTEPQPDPTWTLDLAFSSDGAGLWVSGRHQGRDRLLLLDPDTLDVLDAIAPPPAPETIYDQGRDGWAEATLAVDPDSDRVALAQMCGDSFLKITLHRQSPAGRIETLPKGIGVDAPGFDDAPVSRLGFHQGHVLGLDSYARLWRWTPPDWRVASWVTREGQDHELCDFGTTGRSVVVPLVDGRRWCDRVLVIGPPDAAGRPQRIERWFRQTVAQPVQVGPRLLGLGPDGHWSVSRWAADDDAPGIEEPALVEVDVESGRAARVLVLRDGQWVNRGYRTAWWCPQQTAQSS